MSRVTESELIDFGLLVQVGDRWKYRYSVGAKFSFASSRDDAVAMARDAFTKAAPGELLTRHQRYEQACRDDISASEARWGHMTIEELITMLCQMGGDIASLRNSSCREYNGNGGRRTSAAVSAEGARGTAEMRMKLERYIEHRQERTS